MHTNNKLDGLPLSYWIASTEDTNYPRAEGDIRADVAVIGGGITGLTTAWLLNRANVDVVLLEANRIAKGVSGHTTAKITSQHALIYDKMIKAVGKEKAGQYAEANQSALGMVESIIQENNIQCDLEKQSAYVYTTEEKYLKKMEDEMKAASQIGLPVGFSDNPGLPFNVPGVLEFKNQAQFHPRKYLLTLAQIAANKGCRFYEQSRAVELIEGDTHQVVTDNGARISADSVVLASHYPFYDLPGLYFTRLFPMRSYLLGTRVAGSLPKGMFISAEETPGRTFRTCPDGDSTLFIVGGEHHKTGHGVDLHKHYVNILTFAEDVFGASEAPYRWSAQDYTSMDEIPIVGHLTKDKNRIYLATGFAKWGMSNGTASAMIISDLILKGENPWTPVYDPSRFKPVASAKNFILENADVAKNYVAGKLNIPAGSIQLERGSAAIMEVDGNKVGVYKDMEGNEHIVSATCTHIGCELKWNSAELSWDCPCHGSRFTYTGEVITGPALEGIKPLESR